MTRRLFLAIAVLGISATLLAGGQVGAEDLKADLALNQEHADRVLSRSAEGGVGFSFTYAGVPFRRFVGTWHQEREVERPDATREVRTLTLTDPATKLEVRVVATVYLDTPGVDWTLYFTNRGQQDTALIEEINAVDCGWAHDLGDPPTVLHRLKGGACQPDDWIPLDPTPLTEPVELTTTNGRSSNNCPFFNLTWKDGGLITALGWSGQWTGRVEATPDTPPSVRITSLQLGLQGVRLKLHPGESIRGPRVLQVRYSGNDPWRGYNLFRRALLAHVWPRMDGQVITPPFAHLSTAFYELNDTNETDVLSHLASIRGLGFDTFWLDAYWHGPNGFPGSQGNYGYPLESVEPQDRFPHGLKAIGKAVEKDGLKFLLWFEPERVAAGTRIAREHPEWVISPAKDGSGLFNLGIPAARQYMTDYLNAAVKAYQVTCLRFDYNIDPLGYWQFADGQDPDRQGLTEIRYVEGLYQMWDDLRAANPRLYIDNCASGGRRIDVETLSRSIPLWRSDNTCDMLDHKPETVLLAAMKNQVMSAGLNRYVPFSTAGQMGATPYLFRSGFNGGIAFCEDVRSQDYPRELLKQAIAEGRRVRKYYFGDFYALTPVTMNPRDWCILQYHRPAEQDGMIVAFRRPEAPNARFPLTNLRDLDAEARYEVTPSHDYTPSAPVTMTGAELKALELHIDTAPGSVLVEYRRSPTP